MKRILISTLIVLLSFVLAPSVLAAQNVSSRGYGMGGAYTAVVNDASVLYWNPGALARSGSFGGMLDLGFDLNFEENYELLDDFDNYASEAAQYFIDEDYNLAESYLSDGIALYEEDVSSQINALATLNLGRMGVGFIINEDRELIKLGEGEKEINSFSRIEVVLGLGSDVMELPFGNLSFGTNLKGVAANSFRTALKDVEGIDDNTDLTDFFYEEEYFAYGYAVDAGLLYQLNRVSVGINGRNIVSDLNWDLESDEGWTISQEEPRDTLAQTVAVGTAIRLPLSTILAFDLEIPEEGDNIYRLGAEKNIFRNSLSFRAGAYQQGGDEANRIYTAGFGMNLAVGSLNIAADSEDYGTLTAVFKF